MFQSRLEAIQLILDLLKHYSKTNPLKSPKERTGEKKEERPGEKKEERTGEKEERPGEKKEERTGDAKKSSPSKDDGGGSSPKLDKDSCCGGLLPSVSCL